MVGWHHRLDGHGFGWTPGVGGGQGGLVCCDSWGQKESDTPEQLNRTATSHLKINYFQQGSFPSGTVLNNLPACQYRRHKRHGFNPWAWKIPRRKWQPAPAFLPGKLHGERSLEAYSSWGHKKSDRTKHSFTHFQQRHHKKAIGL